LWSFRYNCFQQAEYPSTLSKRVIIAIVVILVIMVTGMAMTMKRAFRADAIARDPDSTPAKTQPAR